MNTNLLAVVVILNCVKYGSSCGYNTCPETKLNATNVHLICHSHWDAGWVHTFDEYYDLEVSKIIMSVLDSLSQSPNRRFTFVESSFLFRWWSEQNLETRTKFIDFLKKGQITFTSGGWVMNDMASPRYQTIIDQMTLGHQFLRKAFGECGKPKIGWQIDPFGHSKEQASLFSEIGFDGQFLGRIDFQDKENRKRSQKMEFIWRGSHSLGKRTEIFTSTLMGLYTNEEELCFDVKCNNKDINDYNIDRKLLVFLNSLLKQKAAFKTNHLAYFVGGDFHYLNSEKWYRNLDKLIDKSQDNQLADFHVFYSNPQCYLKSVQESMKEWSVEDYDFLPYADKYNAYWSGYFTSRPSLKYNVEYSNDILQAAKQLAVIANLSNIHRSQLRVLMDNVGILLHHDAISGTAKQYVTDDYTRMLHTGVQNGEKVISAAIKKLLLKNNVHILFCNNLNTSECPSTETIETNIDLIVYNPLSKAVHRYIALPVSDTAYSITTKSGYVIFGQVVPVHDFVRKLPDRRSSSLFNLFFHEILPPFSFSMFTVTKLKTGETKDYVDECKNITNGMLTIVIDPKTGLLSQIIKDGRSVNISQNFYTYESAADLKLWYSGAYALRVQNVTPTMWTDHVNVKVIKGELVQEIQQEFTPWISQTIRLFKHSEFIEFEWFVGPIPVKWNGREVITRFDTSLDTKGNFYTDSNARETLERRRNWRPTWNIETSEFVGSNYYPVTGWIFIRDYSKNTQITVLPDRCQGGSSLKDGSIELMVHRRLLHDDFYGVDEPLNEPGVDGKGLVVTGKHRLFVSDIQNSFRILRAMQKEMNHQPILAFTKNGTFNQNRLSKRKIFKALRKELPPNLHILTLEPWENNTILIRIEHLFETNIDAEYSRPRRIPLQKLFKTFRIIEAIEMNLSANERRNISEQQRLKWKSVLATSSNYTKQYKTEVDDTVTNTTKTKKYPTFTITMKPMEIRTFILKIEYN